MSPHPDIPALLAEIGDREKQRERFVFLGPRYLMQTIDQLAELLRITQEERVAFTTALDVADRLIERAYGTDVPQEWHDAYAGVAAARVSLPQGET